jgi:hypothetical protein
MQYDYDPEDWNSTPTCPVHFSPLSLDGTCFHCRSIEAAFKFSKESHQPVSYSEDEDYEDYEDTYEP